MVPIFSPCSWAKVTRSGQTRHRAVVVHDLADHAGGIQPGQARDIDGGFGMTGTHQRAALARHQREHVARRDDVGRPFGRIDRHRHGWARSAPRCRS